jgi:hypothetical protein
LKTSLVVKKIMEKEKKTLPQWAISATATREVVVEHQNDVAVASALAIGAELE